MIVNLMKFTGTKNYVTTNDLNMAVNAAVTLERPLLVKGEAGYGKNPIGYRGFSIPTNAIV